MSTETGQSHTLDGFPAAAVEFVNVMQRNRERIGQDAGLSPSELRALFRVAAEVSVTPKQLAGYLDMTTAAVTFISRRLVESGLLHRVDHPNDRRSLYLELTPLAHQMMLDVHRGFVELLEAATSELSPAELATFSGTLQSVARSMVRHSSRSDTAEPREPLRSSGAGSPTHL
ncbi:MarR family transcriptional regulator [Frigoribacterium sp. UYMn621]|jgi:DNA-binding MarR family transcriptional regulator|uniref:MarR family winged helix-turn-helix transcriptional regulator n=1 Tax=Frigoribacterium sp. UYMn621 TaxID=3156343 RepID=UPI003394E4F2